MKWDFIYYEIFHLLFFVVDVDDEYVCGCDRIVVGPEDVSAVGGEG